MKNKNRVLLVFFVGIILIVAVGAAWFGYKRLNTKEFELSQVCKQGNNGETVKISGFPRLGSETIVCGKFCEISLFERPNERSEDGVNLNVRAGEQKNSIKIPRNDYTDANLDITTNTGLSLGVGDRMDVIGKLEVNEGSCEIKVRKISISNFSELDEVYENAEMIELSEFCSSDDDSFDVVSMVGYLSIPDRISCSEGCDLEFFRERNNAEVQTLKANFLIGDSEYHMEPVPEMYTDEDIKVQIEQDEYVDFSQKVRIYGERDFNSDECKILVEKIEYAE